MGLIDLTQDIKAFCEQYGLTYSGAPRELPNELYKLLLRRLEEELEEYQDAYAADDLVGQFDALLDLIYTTIHTINQHGFPFDDGWELVHGSNMRKMRGTAETSKHNSSYDVVKPVGWVAPNLADLLRIYDCTFCGDVGSGVIICTVCGEHICAGCSAINLLGDIACGKCLEDEELINDATSNDD